MLKTLDKSNLQQINLPYELVLRVYQQGLWKYMMQDLPGLRALTVWPRRNGKDLIALNVMTAKAVQRTGLYLYIGPLHTQTRQIVWMGGTNDGRPFLDYIPRQLIKAKRNSQMEIDLINGSMIKLVGSDQYDSLMGLNAIGAVFTEYSLQRPEAWDYIRPMMAENGGWALFNGTPRGLNHMHAMAAMAEKNPSWFYQYLTRNDTGHPTLEAIQADRDAGMRESLIEQEYFCSWTSSQEEVLIPLDLVSAAVNRQPNRDYVISQPKIMGVDVAYAEKGDQAVIARRQGSFLHPLDKFRGMDNMSLASKVAAYIRSWRPRAVFIDAGRGEGVISRLIQLGHGDVVVPVHFGGKTYSDLYNRKKDEMWCLMKDWFASTEHPACIPDDEELIKDCSAPFFTINDRGFIQIESKQKLKTRGISSTDCGDAVGLTFAEDYGEEPALTKEMVEAGITQDALNQMMGMDAGTKEYDPLNYMDQYTPDTHAAYN